MNSHLNPLRARSHPTVHGASKVSTHDLVRPDRAIIPPGEEPPFSDDSSTESPSPAHLLPNSNPLIPSTNNMSYAGFSSDEEHGENRPRLKPPPAWSTAGIPPWSTATRPLSDIRELTEPSLLEPMHKKHQSKDHDHSIARAISRKFSLKRKDSVRSARSHHSKGEENRGRSSPMTSPQTDRSSIYDVPAGSVPGRSSSAPRRQKSVTVTRPESAPRGQGYTVPNRGRSNSPVKEIAARYNPVTSDGIRRTPSRTFIRPSQSHEILEFPTHRHPRVMAELQVSASLFVGGGSIGGNVRVMVDDTDRVRHKRSLAISRISVDLLGVEEIFAPTRRSVFLNLATELIDSNNPPPHQMVESLKQISPIDPFWLLAPSNSSLPFLISLPLDVGPPPFHSKHARIRYVLCVTLLIREAGRQYLVRSSQEVTVLSVYDPEKALMSLPSPLTASDEYTRPRETGIDVVRVTAGLHRQVWVSGTTIFVDIHVGNNSKKAIKRLDLQLERDLLCYKHAAASTMEKSASQARIFDSNEQVIITKTSLKHGHDGWNGVPPHSTDIRTCGLDLPRGHATVKCGKYFEVRYFLNVIVSASHKKLVSIQLPIVLIHMNSLDIVPNSVAQVAAAIEEKRIRNSSRGGVARRPSTSVQGRAFAAPRMQSLDRMRADLDEIALLRQELDSSPRKYSPRNYRELRPMRSTWSFQTPPSNRKARLIKHDDVEDIRRRLRHVKSNETNRTGAAGVAPSSSVRSNSIRRQHGAGSSLGFREAEVEGELVGNESVTGSNGASFKSRLAENRPRQFQFEIGRKKSENRDRSSSRWGGWGVGRRKGKEKEQEREQRQKQQQLENWI